MMNGYKAFDKDFKCKGFQYEVGKTYETSEEISLCNYGFHFCKKIKDILGYYPISSRFAEIKAIGKVINGDDKSVTNKITIIKELTREELIKLFKYKDSNLGKDNLGTHNTGNGNTGYRNTGDSNTGNGNTGDSNTGNGNTGDRNTGYRNTGYRNTGNSNTGYSNTGGSNTGDWNTGDWNKCDFETGYFNSIQSDNIRVFNKSVPRQVWENCKKPNFIHNVYPNIWISWADMNDEEKKKHPYAYNQDGYLKSISMKEAWEISFSRVTEEEIKLLKSLPNYDYEVFKEITGLTDKRLK